MKAITSPHHLAAWKQSEAYADIVSFILRLNDQVKSKPSTTPHEQSERVRLIVELMERAKGWIDEIPPIQQAMRFGNKAFRTWHARMMEVSGTHPSLQPQTLLTAPYHTSPVCVSCVCSRCRRSCRLC